MTRRTRISLVAVLTIAAWTAVPLFVFPANVCAQEIPHETHRPARPGNIITRTFHALRIMPKKIAKKTVSLLHKGELVTKHTVNTVKKTF